MLAGRRVLVGFFRLVESHPRPARCCHRRSASLSPPFLAIPAHSLVTLPTLNSLVWFLWPWRFVDVIDAVPSDLYQPSGRWLDDWAVMDGNNNGIMGESQLDDLWAWVSSLMRPGVGNHGDRDWNQHSKVVNPPISIGGLNMIGRWPRTWTPNQTEWIRLNRSNYTTMTTRWAVGRGGGRRRGRVVAAGQVSEWTNQVTRQPRTKDSVLW